MTAALEHLVFFNPESGIIMTGGTAPGDNAWQSNPSSTPTYSEGLLALSEMACGGSNFFTGGPMCTGGGMVGSLFNMVGYEILMLGFSNGGGLAVYAHLTTVKVTKAIAIDYYGDVGSQGSNSWIPHQSGTGELNLKIYTACASPYYATAAVTTGSTTFQATAGLSFTASTGVVYPPAYTGASPLPFTEYEYLGANGEMYYAVHGLGPTGSCTSNQITGNIHVKVSNYPGYLQDVVAWTSAPSPPPAPPLAPGIRYTGTSRRLEEQKGRRALRGEEAPEEEAPMDWADSEYADKMDFETKAAVTPKPQKFSPQKMASLTREDKSELASDTAKETATYWDGVTH
jgi:hypothetical protein